MPANYYLKEKPRLLFIVGSYHTLILFIARIILWRSYHNNLNNEYYMIDKTSIKQLQGFGYNREEAINILNGLNPDGTQFEQLPF